MEISFVSFLDLSSLLLLRTVELLHCLEAENESHVSRRTSEDRRGAIIVSLRGDSGNLLFPIVGQDAEIAQQPT